MNADKPLSYYAAKFAFVYVMAWAIVLALLSLVLLPLRMSGRRKPRGP